MFQTYTHTQITIEKIKIVIKKLVLNIEKNMKFEFVKKMKFIGQKRIFPWWSGFL